jgi:hypothetical protein
LDETTKAEIMLPLVTATMVIVFAQNYTEEVELTLSQYELDQSAEQRENLDYLNHVWVEDAARIKLKVELEKTETVYHVSALLLYEKVQTLLTVNVEADFGDYTEHYELELTPEILSESAPAATSLHDIDDATITRLAANVVFETDLSGYERDEVALSFSWER